MPETHRKAPFINQSLNDKKPKGEGDTGGEVDIQPPRKGLIVIFKMLVVEPFQSNCYIVGSESTKEGMVIDPGAGAKEIVGNANQLGLDIKLIVLTHGHVDHIGAIKEVKEATGAEFAIHADELETLREHGQSLSAMFGHSYATPPHPDRLLKGGDSIDLGDLHFLVAHTPGHSLGGICLVGHGVVFTGDTLFNYGIGRTDFPGGSYSQLLNGIHTELMTLPDSTVVYPGHGPESTIGAERRGNPFLRGGSSFPF